MSIHEQEQVLRPRPVEIQALGDCREGAAVMTRATIAAVGSVSNSQAAALDPTRFSFADIFGMTPQTLYIDFEGFVSKL
jgi:hypothetical protein